jgi:hypothetical protein
LALATTRSGLSFCWTLLLLLRLCRTFVFWLLLRLRTNRRRCGSRRWLCVPDWPGIPAYLRPLRLLLRNDLTSLLLLRRCDTFSLSLLSRRSCRTFSLRCTCRSIYSRLLTLRLCSRPLLNRLLLRSSRSLRTLLCDTSPRLSFIAHFELLTFSTIRNRVNAHRLRHITPERRRCRRRAGNHGSII